MTGGVEASDLMTSEVTYAGDDEGVLLVAEKMAGKGFGVSVVIEVHVLRAREDGLHYYPLRRPLLSPHEPETVAKALCGSGSPPDLLHSTSWREENGTIILTYVAVTDKEIAGPGHLVSDEVATGDGPSAPAPDDLALDDVAAHACRHLAFLAATDPHVARALQRHPDVRRHVNKYLPDVAGELSQTR
jgi:hypothetical protein